MGAIRLAQFQQRRHLVALEQQAVAFLTQLGKGIAAFLQLVLQGSDLTLRVVKFLGFFHKCFFKHLHLFTLSLYDIVCHLAFRHQIAVQICLGLA